MKDKCPTCGDGLHRVREVLYAVPDIDYNYCECGYSARSDVIASRLMDCDIADAHFYIEELN